VHGGPLNVAIRERADVATLSAMASDGSRTTLQRICPGQSAADVLRDPRIVFNLN